MNEYTIEEYKSYLKAYIEFHIKLNKILENDDLSSISKLLQIDELDINMWAKSGDLITNY